MARTKYLELVVYRKALGGQPFINQIVKLFGNDPTDGSPYDDCSNCTVADLLRNQIRRLRPNFIYLDSEIVSITTQSESGLILGSDILQEPASDIADFQKVGATRWYLLVRIDAQPTAGRTDGESNAGFFNLVQRSNAKEYLKPTFSRGELTEFYAECNNCSNATELKAYLRRIGLKKITTDLQIQTLLCNFLEDNKLGYISSDLTMRSQCLNAMNRVRRVLEFMRRNIRSIIVNNLTTINNNTVLKGLTSVVATGINEINSKAKSTSSAELEAQIQSMEKEKKKNVNCWPSAYHKTLVYDETKKVGQAIFDLEESMLCLIHSTLQRLGGQATRTATRNDSEAGETRPDLSNSGFELRKGHR